LLFEGAAKKLEREQNARAWQAWHIAALQRMKKMPELKKLFVNNTEIPRQTWRQQLATMQAWAADHNAFIERQRLAKENGDGR